MNAHEVLSTLRTLGKPATARVYRRHGVVDPTLGVPHADLGRLVKRLHVDHALAQGLWDSGVHEARVLATRIADASRVRGAELERWLGQARDYVTTDAIAALAARTPAAWTLARRWIRSSDEWVSAAGWQVVSLLALNRTFDVELADKLITQIRRGIGRAKNRTRHSMNSALIAIGGTMEELTDVAKIAAHNIGEVVVDHGDTDCVTPDAVAYIDRMVKRGKTRPRQAKARTSTRAPGAKARTKATAPKAKRAAAAKGTGRSRTKAATPRARATRPRAR